MVKNHMKRLTAPKTWKVPRKQLPFITKPYPGAHNKNLSISINTFLKELTFLTKTTKETKYLLTKQEVKVNGVRIRDDKYAVGLLDIIEVPFLNKTYTISIDTTGSLKATEYKEKQLKTLLKITGKSIQKKGKVQLNTLSGRNLLVDEKEAKKFKKGDSLIISVPDNKILSHISREKGAQAFVFTGKHAGKKGKIEEIGSGIVKIKTNKDTFETEREYVLVIGKDKIELNVDA